jgi:hypothetical protein
MPANTLKPLNLSNNHWKLCGCNRFVDQSAQASQRAQVGALAALPHLVNQSLYGRFDGLPFLVVGSCRSCRSCAAGGAARAGVVTGRREGLSAYAALSFGLSSRSALCHGVTLSYSVSQSMKQIIDRYCVSRQVKQNNVGGGS